VWEHLGPQGRGPKGVSSLQEQGLGSAQKRAALMAWIEVHQSLASHHKTMALAEALGIKPPQAVGHVVLFWLWALDNAPTGDLTDLSPRMIAAASQWGRRPEIFIEAMIASGFLARASDFTISIHNWQDYTGRLIQRRQADRERMRERRLSTEQTPNRSRTVQEPSPNSSGTDEERSVAPNSTQPNSTVPNPTKNTVRRASAARTVVSGDDILRRFTLEELAGIRQKYPALVLEEEAAKCFLWWQEMGKPLKRPKGSFNNWMEKAEKIRLGDRNNGTGQGQPPPGQHVETTAEAAKRTQKRLENL